MNDKEKEQIKIIVNTFAEIGNFEDVVNNSNLIIALDP